MGAHDHDDDGDWEWDERPRRRPRRRKSAFGRAFTLVKLALFLLPLGLFLFGSTFADCRTRPTVLDWRAMIGASTPGRWWARGAS